MHTQDLTVSFIVEQSPDVIFNAINNVRGWWGGEITGETTKVGDEFTYRYHDLHTSTQQITDLVPGKKVVWKVLDSNLSFLTDPTEWTNTEIVFDISRNGEGTELRLTHKGLTPNVECFEACSGGWQAFVGRSLRSLVTTGVGQPDLKL